MSIKFLLPPREKDLGEFTVRRLLPDANQRMVGPWIFFDHMGPAQFTPGEGVNVRPHPHINLATVTYLFEGEILHRDSLGTEQAIRSGDLNLMVAGSGIVHSERERPEVNATTHTVHGLQLWHALPEEDEECEPAFYHYQAQQIPTIQVNDVILKVLIGTAYGHTSPVKTFTDTLYLEASLQAQQTLVLPQKEQLAVYVVEGEIEVSGEKIPQYTMLILEDNATCTILAAQMSRVVLIGGSTLSKRYVEWNFVSSRQERIEQAKRDWAEGRFPKVSNDAEEYIPLPK